jgi:uncharacterized damage-inducible protein DinB
MKPTNNPTTNPIDILLSHNLWANHQILTACAALTGGQFHQRFEIGRGSLHDTMAHVIWAMGRWTDTLVKRDARAPFDGKPRTVEELRQWHDELAAEIAVAAQMYPPAEIVTTVRGGKNYSYTRAAVLCHVTTHGMHHRAQCLNMLRHLGVSPLPPSSVAEWSFLVDFPQ